MLTGSETFSSDYKSLQETLAQYDGITIVNTEGSPPEKYEIEYRTQGYAVQTDGKIGLADRHRVSLTLPLGYPGTPPIAKTLSSTYHPEINNDTIHIAHYWLKNSSLPALVIHIGKMIRGEIFNTEAPHNEQALEWFERNKERLPLPATPPASQSGLSDQDIELVDSVLESSQDQAVRSVDCIADTPDDEALRQAEFAKEEISTAINHKKFFTAQRLLNNLGTNLQQADKDKFAEDINTAVQRVNELVAHATALEEEDKFQDALNIINQIPEITKDLPGFSDIRERLSQSMNLARSLNAFEEEQSGNNSLENLAEETNNKPDLQETISKKNRPKLPRLQIPKINLPELPYARIVIISILLAFIILPTYFYFKDRSILKQAETDWRETQHLIKQKKFQQALESAEDLKASLADISMLQRDQHELLYKIDNVLLSKDFIEGLQGRVFYNGNYIAADKFFKLKHLEVLMEQAEQLEDQGKTNQAVRFYDKARIYAANNALGTNLTELQDKINKIQLEQILQTAKNAEQSQQWSSAADSYQKALAVVHNLSVSSQDDDTMQKINQALASASFKDKLNQSRKSMAAEDWRQTVRLLQLADEIMITNPEVIPIVEQKEAAILLADSQLQLLLSEAKTRYKKGNWEISVKKYEEVLQLLSDKEGLFSHNTQNLASQIELTVLMTRIAGEQSRATLAEKNKDATTALSHYSHVVNLINQSKFKNDPNPQQILKNTLAQIEATKIQAKIRDKVAWLREHHSLIFKKHYPYIKTSKLLYPKVNFVGEKNGNMIFELSCIDKSQGRPSQLMLSYEYDSQMGRWRISSNQF